MNNNFQVAIIGAGGSGIFAARELEQKGIAYTVFEANAKVGGTWLNNQYPGIACDVKQPLYGFPFNPMDTTSQQPSGAELRQYFEDTARKIGMYPKIQFSTKVTDATWESSSKKWIITDSKGNVTRFNALISCCGQLNIPRKVSLTGASEFKGVQVHSTDWDPTMDVTGKKIAVIGSGPTAAQMIPALAQRQCELTLFQRTVPWILPIAYETYTEEKKKQRNDDPTVVEAETKQQYDEFEALFGAMIANSPGQAMVTKLCSDFMTNAWKGSKVEKTAMPSYPLAVKRVVVSPISNKEGTHTIYTEALLKDNVELVRSSIDRIEANGVRTADGKSHPVDILAYATGFESQTFVNTSVTGTKGTLVDAWDGVPRGYYGIMVPDFPNFFMVYGPGTNLGHNSVLLMSDIQSTFIGKALDAIKNTGGSIAVTQDAFDAYYEVHKASIAQTTWAQKGIDNWYKAGQGGVVVNNCGTSVEEYKRVVAEAGDMLADTMTIDGKSGSFGVKELPGKQGNALRDASTDPRVDPRLRHLLKALGVHVGAPAPMPCQSPITEGHYAWGAAVEAGFEGLITALYTQICPVPEIKGLEQETIAIKGRDGNEIKLYVTRPADQKEPLPGVVHMHGGGFLAFGNTLNNFVTWRNSLASRGMVTIGVEMRNTGGKFGRNAFPVPLNDCVDGLKHVIAHKSDLKISKVFTNGESAGGNLSIATALALKKEGITGLSGIFASCPFISNMYHTKDPALPSLTHSEDYFVANNALGLMADLYTRDAKDAKNPMAWPYWATVEDLKNLPPTIISVNECDMLFSEGKAFHKKLVKAGVKADLRIVPGTVHATEQYFQGLVPDLANDTLDAIAAFVKA